jgi:hypothetical protein
MARKLARLDSQGCGFAKLARANPLCWYYFFHTTRMAVLPMYTLLTSSDGDWLKNEASAISTGLRDLLRRTPPTDLPRNLARYERLAQLLCESKHGADFVRRLSPMHAEAMGLPEMRRLRAESAALVRGEPDAAPPPLTPSPQRGIPSPRARRPLALPSPVNPI